MNTTDPIADMLTRIRNANSKKHKTVDVPASNMKKAIANILFKEGYIAAYEEINDNTQGVIRITLKYDENEKEYNQQYIGKEVEVLLEEREGEYLKGHTTNYMVVKMKTNENLENTIQKIIVQ